ncbi:histidine kinase dimerization/phospho-acceptor domain-containing protein [Nocardioides sp. SOB77]|uniref:histidine kinase n=1 Tax=Nocardioides oceani TaxID=3058369 RepID=A0ABT8FLY5_9ACTN|nr:histidine kinase dimerization/phospho-acceptor domain-containing protein [Nocardioides oceani]MDN4175678.1 histidine kinase dimerization/phospho-acceptor domain-containing protein [Nocardioides oceani]
MSVERTLFELLQSPTSLAVAASDATGALTLLTPALEDMLGRVYQPWYEDELPAALGLLCEDGLTPLDATDLPIARARRGEVVRDAVVTVLRPDSGLRYLRRNGTPMRDVDGTITGAVVIVQDVTEERLARERVDQLRRLLITTLNHELRTPVAKVRGSVETLEDLHVGLPSWAQRSLEIARRGTMELVSLTDLISRLVELEAATRPSRVLVDVAEVTRRAAGAVQSIFTSRQAALGVSAPAPVSAFIDDDLARRAVADVLVEVMRSAPTGAAVEAKVTADDENYAVVVVAAGPGSATSQSRTWVVNPVDLEVLQLSTSAIGSTLSLAATVAAAHGGSLGLSESPTGQLSATLRLARSVR